ncbi:hypothetical protein CHGG_10925 [Chaetomium globosum CBS 148.51]|uniref:Inosine/uridine-preferring nucleoside hydrolase domain-containing protein n=1 Tax=Chaetomium globosum (strain ATCC 6205 / CBS 148.51 / DSM 1962 / NBRC 6347 / NRRL 1970) TaxID=306901 RepID=Q2GM79_CHAGB|nr:uncharacterized protein CHGG_10925 [Chaetomium globosum CBS 148.51]EAQ83107.1 hypothetical protein CHGG_10925 [Chaetomium globosum CBS 148.51]
MAIGLESVLASGCNRKPIIIDTDLFSDVDDVGSLAIANVLQNYGVADLLGVVINSHSQYGALAASVVNTYFGNGNISIGAIRPLTNETFFDTYNFLRGEYAAKIAQHWPRQLNDSSATPTPVQLYRSILSAADDKSVTIISIGFLTNLAALLEDDGPDSRSLISAKVKELVVMGGQYPSGREFNFGGVDPASAHKAINNWPRQVPVTYIGFELGKDIFSGGRLTDSNAPTRSPVLAAYQWYVGRCSTLRESWDPITTLYGICGIEGCGELGMGKLFEFANDKGYNWVGEDGSNEWVNDTGAVNQHWLKLAEGVTNEDVAWWLDRFIGENPDGRRCPDLACDDAWDSAGFDDRDSFHVGQGNEGQ